MKNHEILAEEVKSCIFFTFFFPRAIDTLCSNMAVMHSYTNQSFTGIK